MGGARPPAPDDAVALVVRDPRAGAVLAYCPCAGALDESLVAALYGADWIFFDGTFWSSDELVRAGAGTNRAEDLAHVPMTVPAEASRACAGCAGGASTST